MKRKFSEIEHHDASDSICKRPKFTNDFDDWEPIPNTFHYRSAWKIMYQELENYGIRQDISDVCAQFLHLDEDLVHEHNELAKEKRVREEHERDGWCKHGTTENHHVSVEKCVEQYYDDSYFCMFCYKYLFSDIGGEEYAGCGGCMGFFCYDCLGKCKGFHEILQADAIHDFTDKCPVCCL